MILWFVFALMTAAAILAVLWPLSRRGPERGGSDIAVYRDQLDEIIRDRAAGLIGEAEAEAAKVLDSFGAPHRGDGKGATHIFNLGHGISQHTPPENVQVLVEAVRAHSTRLRGA